MLESGELENTYAYLGLRKPRAASIPPGARILLGPHEIRSSMHTGPLCTSTCVESQSDICILHSVHRLSSLFKR